MSNVVPDELQGDFRVKVFRGEHRGAVQYYGGHIHGYKMVIDTSRRCRVSISEGETWVITPERIIGNIAFCWPQRKLLNADGQHPIIAVLKGYAERRCRVSIRWHPDSRFEERLASIEIDGRDNVVTLKFIDGTTHELRHFYGKPANYGRYSADAYRRDSTKLHVVFWEN